MDNDQRQASNHFFEYRPWGMFRTITKSENFHIKVINVYPDGKLSLQSHKHRSEHWVVIAGTASVVVNDKDFELFVNESTFIKNGDKHMLENKGDEDLRIIEIQTGNYLEEDDIIRYNDKYNRI
ncbi:phosphomannose isomerase type II C-terminal cupin domain [Alphaproteobacteria bacterium]|nr:phosphomannose isomerase type II C-terminal cupin domain [Alphaproteobacteria bacterium]